MKNINALILFVALLTTINTLYSQPLFEIKDDSNSTVLEVAADGLRIFNQGDTLMVISSSEIKAFVSDSKDRALSRSFSVSTNASGKAGQNSIFEITEGTGSTFFNPADNSDKILSINENSIQANVNPSLNRDFTIEDEISSKGSGNLMKISNESVFETVNDSTMLWYKDRNAFRVGYVLITDPNKVGRGSFASGYQSQAEGNFSTALGKEATASGEASFASGLSSWASGDNASALGKDATASGDNSFAIGYNTEASGNASFAGGSSTTASGVNSVAFGALASATDEYACALGGLAVANQYGSTAAGIGAWATGSNSTAIGSGARASNTYTVALSSRLAEASGYGSAAIGYYTDATGSYSTALGYYSLANNSYATALGRNTEASGYNSTAMGYNSLASGYYSTAIGYGVTARPYCAFVVGRYNAIGGTSTSWVSGEPIFIVGNGTSDTSRNNAFKVEKDGTIYCPDAYTRTTSLDRKDLKVASNGLLCVLSKEEKGYDDQDVVELIKENKELSEKVFNQELRISKLEKMVENLLDK